jgi:hypothetical protein
MDVSLSAGMEQLVNERLKSGPTSAPEVIADALRLLQQQDQQGGENGETGEARPIWEVFLNVMSDVPQEELDQLPTDAAEQHDHYIYGLSKKPR